MKFNDYQIISPKDSEIIAQEYNKILTKEIEDLYNEENE